MVATATGRGNIIARKLPRGHYTISDAATRIGISPDTLRRWCRLGIMPHDNVAMGKLIVRTFTAAHIAAGKRIHVSGEGELKGRVPKPRSVSGG